MDGATGERALIDERVARVLKRPVRVDAYRVLGRGISGAATYRVNIDGTDAVLKLTAARSALGWISAAAAASRTLSGFPRSRPAAKAWRKAASEKDTVRPISFA